MSGLRTPYSPPKQLLKSANTCRSRAYARSNRKEPAPHWRPGHTAALPWHGHSSSLDLVGVHQGEEYLVDDLLEHRGGNRSDTHEHLRLEQVEGHTYHQRWR